MVYAKGAAAAEVSIVRPRGLALRQTAREHIECSPNESAVGADSISARQPAAIHNRGEVLRLLPFLLPMATCTNAPGLSLCNIHINF